MGRLTRLLVALVAGGGVLACGSGDDVPPFPFAVTSFPARVEVASTDRLSVVPSLAGRHEVIDLSAAPVPELLRSVVRSQWRGTCDVRVGDDVLVSVLDSRALLLQRKRGTEPPTAGASPYELCVASTYFDLVGIGPTQAWRERMRGLAMVLGGLADYDVPARVYVRGDAEVVLAAYREPREVESAARRLGEPQLAASAARIAAKRNELKRKTVVAEVIPYRYPSRLQAPVGWRGYFVLRVFEERGRQLVTQVDVAADAVR